MQAEARVAQAAPKSSNLRALKPVARHTFLVSVVKKGLWAAALLILGLILYLSNDPSSDSGSRIVFQSVQKGEDAPVQMMKPRYQGVDTENRPYTVTADTATQLEDKRIALEKIVADMTLKDTTWVAMHSDTGILDMGAKLLDLEGNIDIFYEGGYEFRTQKALVDFSNGSAISYTPVEGQGPTGTIKSDAFEMKERGKVLLFQRNVHVVLFNEKDK